MSLAAALMQKQHRGKPPGIAELAVEVLEVRDGGVCGGRWSSGAGQHGSRYYRRQTPAL